MQDGGVHASVLCCDVLLMTERAAVENGGGEEGTGRPDLLSLLNISLHPLEFTLRLLF